MDICILRDKGVPWFGNYTGYDQLPRFIREINPKTKVINSYNSRLQHYIGRAYSFYRGWLDRSPAHVAAEFRFLLNLRMRKNRIYHILYYEYHHPVLENWIKAPRRIIATIHTPPIYSASCGHLRKWYIRRMDNFKRLTSAIILYQRDMEFFEKHIGRKRIKFIHHGVDTDFFSPAYESHILPKIILFVGQNGRNTAMLCRVIKRLAILYPELRFDLLVPEEKRFLDGLKELLTHPSVLWHQGISDENLRRIYQKSYLLLLPLDFCGANSAIVEALACGSPIVTTDVGGISDYAGGSIYPVVKNNDDDAMISLIEQYLSRPEWRDEIAGKCRQFAEENLAWPIVAKKHLEAYKSFL